jgi:hypothetical protein
VMVSRREAVSLGRVVGMEIESWMLEAGNSKLEAG